MRSACSQRQFPKSRVGMIAGTVSAQHHGTTSSVDKDIKLALIHDVKELPFLALSKKVTQPKDFPGIMSQPPQ